MDTLFTINYDQVVCIFPFLFLLHHLTKSLIYTYFPNAIFLQGQLLKGMVLLRNLRSTLSPNKAGPGVHLLELLVLLISYFSL